MIRRARTISQHLCCSCWNYFRLNWTKLYLLRGKKVKLSLVRTKGTPCICSKNHFFYCDFVLVTLLRWVFTEFTECSTSIFKHSFTFQELITQKRSTFDPMLVKLKCVFEAYIYFDFSAVYLLNFQLLVCNFQINFTPLKRITDLPPCSQKCIFSEL